MTKLMMTICTVDGSEVSMPCEPGATLDQAQDAAMLLLKTADFSVITEEDDQGVTKHVAHIFNTAHVSRICVWEDDSF